MAADTLFAHVVPKVTDQIERVATEALAYILSGSKSARRGLEKLVADGGVACGEITYVKTEVRREDSRVDLVGFDAKGLERLLVEVKFWAELTDKQPNTYLKRLPSAGPGVLLFVVPGTRVEHLWTEVRQRASEKHDLPPIEQGRRLSVALGEHGLMMTSWRVLLDKMAAAASTGGDSKAEAEINQLRGLTMKMDMEAFLPLSSDDLKPSIPRRILGLMRLVDAVVASLGSSGLVKPSKKSQPRGGGFGWWLDLNGREVWFGVSWSLWGQHGVSPLWLWSEDQEARAALAAHRNSPDDENFPIDLPPDAEYDTVLNAVVGQLEQAGKVIGRDPK